MQRPTSVTVFGVLNIIFAAFGILGVLGTVAMFASQGGNTTNPVIQIMHNSPGYATWLKASIVFGAVACAALLAAGIGLLKLLPWARTVSMVYAVFAIVMNVVGTVVNYFCLLQPMLAQAHDKSGPEAAAALGGAIGGMIGGCFGMIYPVLLFIFMLRANVKVAFGVLPPTPTA
jgi:hypothetical protein